MANYNLSRFIEAQNKISYQSVLDELRQANKQGHWMWFIFPQIKGLGNSTTSNYYGIENLEEASAYLADPVLGERLVQCTKILLSLSGHSAQEIFGSPDYLKLRSSLTLFEQASDKTRVFTAALEKYYQGKRDEKTLELIDDAIA